jgi:hypothetical protein
MYMPGGHDVVQVGMGLNDACDVESELLSDTEDAFSVPAGVKDPPDAGLLVAEDGAVALERSDRNGFSNEFHPFMVPF